YQGDNGTSTVDIDLRPITVSAKAQTKFYGATDPALTFTITSGSLAIGDNFTGYLTRDPGEKVGDYPIRQGTFSAGTNYDLTYVGANFTITAIKTSLILSSSTSISVPYQAVTFTAKISVSPGVPAPSGKVTFKDGTTILGTVDLVNCNATLTTDSLVALGKH